uniref:Cwf19-like C-terminal domain-containing protein n=1 Tax=Timema genevievae TaxID=629358 RepID=A0A7R9K598_TIMGE|nr:unnamed protein product [Timema genevievae]
MFSYVMFKSALKKYFKTQEKVPVFFERNYKTSHLQMQVVPVHVKLADQLKEMFQPFRRWIRRSILHGQRDLLTRGLVEVFPSTLGYDSAICKRDEEQGYAGPVTALPVTETRSKVPLDLFQCCL